MYETTELKDRLYTAVLSDVLDDLGYPHQAVAPFMRPLDESLSFVGRARTGLYANAYSILPDENPYELEIKLVDDLKHGDVAVIACDGPTTRMAPWGELLSTAAMKRGAAACVTDGLVRDVRHIRAMGFPVHHGGIGPLDSKGRCKMVEMDRPIVVGGVRVDAQDWVFGDIDGVIIIPVAMADEVFGMALEKVTRENHTRDELRRGTLLADVYAKYGVL